jgi:hypothetical protein
VDERLTELALEWLAERRASLAKGHGQDLAVSEVLAAYPDLAPLEPMSLGWELFAALAGAEVGEAEVALIVVLESTPGKVTDAPDRRQVTAAADDVQVHVTPPDAGSESPMDVFTTPVDWPAPAGFPIATQATYSVARPVGPEFSTWEYDRMVTIRRG